ncbi:MAG TPA: HD domain-containing phosphohydrolase [Terriglobales bacterium]|nr:HD domain-containing phosphohydrolase [Terriglobales bacterium]
MAVCMPLTPGEAQPLVMPFRARAFWILQVIAGVGVIAWSAANWQNADPLRFCAYLLVALLASTLRVSLPGLTGSISVNFLFILIGISELTLPQTMLMGCSPVLVQSLWKLKQRPRYAQLIFQLANTAVAIAVSYGVYHRIAQPFGHSVTLVLLAAAFAYFVTGSALAAALTALTQNKAFRRVWHDGHFWSLPYYLLGAGVAALVSYINVLIGWQTSLLVLPIIYWTYRSYRVYLRRLSQEKDHVESIASLHLRTIEALALAIEAKDHSTFDHLQRVRVYALEVAKELEVPKDEIEALRAASLLHDIGKLAIPEHIINKPGKLTPEEFEKMKIHPLVGAEILERVNFPYPVVPIVRAHHERWDGSGYPYGLRGEEIPMCARILAAVDCLDALNSHRQYRRAVPLPEAMEVVAAESGRAFDPRVVDVLKRRYLELEKLAQTQMTGAGRQRLSTDLRLSNAAAPASGFAPEKLRPLDVITDGNFLSSIAAARQEAQTLFELSHELGNSLSLDDTLSVLSVRLRKLIPYDSIAIYVLREHVLVPEHVSGDNFRVFSSLQIPVGEGVSGWVAAHRKPIVNGDPACEPGYPSDARFSPLRSALAVPLEALSGVVGVLTLYKGEGDAFTSDHLRIMLAVSSKVALSVENALKYQQAENSATTDYLTGLPNARSLFLHLDQEIARCKRTGADMAVLICDLDGFKEINDRFGHLEGNKVLRSFGHGVRSVCREYDYVARMGGDEFVIIAPGLKHEAAADKIAVLDQLAREAGHQVCGTDRLSVSTGMAYYGEDGTDGDQLLAEADRRMYIMKQQHHRKSEEIKPLTAEPELARGNE